MSTNLRALPQRPQDEATVEEKAIEALRLLIRQEIVAIERERANAAPQPESKQELTVEEVARLKRVKPRTIYEWIKADPPRLKFHRTPSGRIRFYRRDVEE